jgi:hypothetical protein
VGRHSAPDPEDSAGNGVPDEPPTQRFSRQEPVEPDYGFDRPHYGEPSYPSTPYPDDDYNTRYDADYDAGYDSDYEQAEYESDYEPDYDDRDYDDADYGEADEDYSETETSRLTASGPRTGPAHSGEWEGGEWTGSHRAVTTKRRGVSVGVIVALVAVVVLVGAFILWRFFGDALSHRTDALAARCVNGELAVAVVADPSIADQVHKLADTFNQTAAPVADKCVKVGVRPADPDQVVDGFIGKWPAELGAQPALWIPASSVSEARLEAAAGQQTVSDSRSLVTTPVVLAVRPQLKDALGQQNWGALPGLQTNPTALDALNLSGWGPLRLALPSSGNSDASYLAAEAVATAAAPSGQPATAGTGAVNTLVGGQPKLADNKLSTAMDALLNAPDPASAQVHAVVTTEQQLFQLAASTPDVKGKVTSWLPAGPTAVADYPTVLLSGSWLSQDQASAASEFARYMRKSEQLAELAKAGFRSEGHTPPKSDVTNFAPLAAPVSVGDTSTRATLANALTAPAESPAVTIMLDQSMPTEEGGKSRVANVVAALNARLQALPGNAAVGLWTFDGVEGRSEVSTGPLSDQVGGQPRTAALTSALNSQSASGGGAVSFTTLRMVYDQAKSNFRQDQNNSVLVITEGPHTDQSLDGSGLQQYIRGAFDQSRPVAVNVIDFGNDSDRATWEAVAQASGGTYQNVANSTSPDLTTAITQFLG